MATKAKTSSKARSAKTTRSASGAAARTTKKSTTVKAPVVKTRAAVAQSVTRQGYRLSDDLSGSQVLGEMLGSFMLVMMVAATGGNAFLVGIALIVIVAMFYGISGAHINPAVSLGWFVMRRITAAKMLFYWMAQFVGAIAAILTINAFAGTKLSVSLGSFAKWDWWLFAAELVGTAVFMLGIAAAVRRGQSDTDKAVGMGLALFVGLLLSSYLLQQAATHATSTATDATDQPRIAKLSGTTLNPAVALSLNETDASNVNPLTGEQTGEKKTTPSRFTIETILATLLGAGLGGRLYLLLARNDRD